jgi:transposase
MAAQSLHRSKSDPGDWFRRLKSKLGTKAAVTAAAHKLARILWDMVKHLRPYDPSPPGKPERVRLRKEHDLHRHAKQPGFALPPVGGEASSESQGVHLTIKSPSKERADREASES